MYKRQVPYSTSSIEDLYINDEYVEDYDHNSDKEETVIMRTPSFVSESKSALVNEGGTIRLPCIVDRLEGFVLLWKKGEDIITVGSQIVNKVKQQIIN